jgi:hypothetical protein
MSACFLDLMRAVPERGQVLPAERSAEVAQERNDDRPLPPQLRQRDIVSFVTGKRRVGCWLSNFDHGSTSRRTL